MSDPDPNRLLAIYLDDHWAGAGAGRALARRLHRHNDPGPWADRLRRLADEIDRDLGTLDDVRAALDLDGGGVKRALALAGERAGRLKPNGRILRHSPLSRVIEAEALMAGVAAKHRLWAALQECTGNRPELEAFDFAALARTAEDQLEMLRAFHREAAADAFSS